MPVIFINMGRMFQQPFDFVNLENYAESDFIVSSSNEEAFNFLENWCSNPVLTTDNPLSRIVVIYGDKGCGKTHIAHIWQKQHHAKIIQCHNLITSLPLSFVDEQNYYILEDFDSYLPDIEVSLFHLINTIAEKGKYLLLTAKVSPSKVEIHLPDLKSRLNAIYSAEVKQPDDELLRALLIKYFSDRQIKIDINVINYLLARIERSFDAVRNIVDTMDKKALVEKRNITVKLARETFGMLE